MRMTEVTFAELGLRWSWFTPLEGRCLALSSCPVKMARHPRTIGETITVNSGPAPSVYRPAATAAGAPEWDVVLAASSADARERVPGRVRELIERPVDWEALLRLADHHGTSSLLYQN